jgi:hypothetical protein
MDSVKVASALRLLAEAFDVAPVPAGTPPTSAPSTVQQAPPSAGKPPKKAAKPAATEAAAPAKEPEAPVADLRTQLADAVTALANGVEGEFTGSVDIAKGILKKYKVGKVSQMAEKDLADALADVNAEIGTAKAESASGSDSLI